MRQLTQMYFLRDGSLDYLPQFYAVQKLHSFFSLHNIKYYVTGCFARMCYNSKELTDDLDILTINCELNYLVHELRQDLSISNIVVKHKSIKFSMNINDVVMRVDLILAPSNFNYGEPNNSFGPFCVLSLPKLVEHYLFLMDERMLSFTQITKYLSGVQNLIEHKKLDRSFGLLLSEPYQPVFNILIDFRDEENPKMDPFDLLSHIESFGCKFENVQ